MKRLTPSSVAIHEAGHALAAWREGFSLGKASIGAHQRRPLETGRVTYFSRPIDSIETGGLKKMWRVTLAGPKAEAIMVQAPLRPEALVEPAELRLALALPERDAEVRRLRDAAMKDSSLPDFLEEAWKILQGGFADTREQDAILNLAARLDAETQVCGQDCALAFEEIFKDARPPEALPVNRHSAAGGKLEKKSKGAALTAALRALEGAEADLRAACADDAELERPLLAVMQARFKIHDEIVVEMERLEAQGKSGSFLATDFTTET